MRLLHNNFTTACGKASHRCEVKLIYFSDSKCGERQGTACYRLGQLCTDRKGCHRGHREIFKCCKIIIVQVLLLNEFPSNLWL